MQHVCDQLPAGIVLELKFFLFLLVVRYSVWLFFITIWELLLAAQKKVLTASDCQFATTIDLVAVKSTKLNSAIIV